MKETKCLLVLEALGRAAAEPQGSEAGVEFDTHGSALLMEGTEGGVPHGSEGTAGLGADPEEKFRAQFKVQFEHSLRALRETLPKT